MQMAGLARTPAERRMAREHRRALKAAAQQEARVLLVDQIRQREQGEAGSKPMPFAGVRERILRTGGTDGNAATATAVRSSADNSGD